MFTCPICDNPKANKTWALTYRHRGTLHHSMYASERDAVYQYEYRKKLPHTTDAKVIRVTQKKCSRQRSPREENK